MTDPSISPSLPEGLIIELVSPLTTTGTLDQESLMRLLSHLAPVADGLLAGGPIIGEGLALPPATRLTLLRCLSEVLPRRLPLFFAVTADTLEATRELALAAAQVCHGHHAAPPVFLVDLPLWYHSNRGLPQFYEALLSEVGLPLLLLNLPKLVGQRGKILKHRNIRTQVLKKMSANPGIRGLIYQGDMRRFLNYHQAVAHHPGFIFYEASEVAFVERPGAWGLVSAGAQLFPQTWRRVVRACRQAEELADSGASRPRLWQECSLLLELSSLYQPAPAPLLKIALQARGLLANSLTAPATRIPLPPDRERFLKFLSQMAD